MAQIYRSNRSESASRALDIRACIGIKTLTHLVAERDPLMAKNSPPNPKLQSLRKHGSLNPNADRVVDPNFVGADFFDARDLVQVKYEMLRRVSVDGQPVSHSAAAFGFSRPSFYQAQTALKDGGLAALVPKRRGPRRSHKLSTEVMELVQRELSTDTSLNSSELALRIEARFGRKVHPRSVERALARQKKKRL